MLCSNFRYLVCCAIYYPLHCFGDLGKVSALLLWTRSRLTEFRAPYNYNALYIGLIVLSFGIGSICGSVLGGRYSDRVLRKLKKANGGVLQSEVSLNSKQVLSSLIVVCRCDYEVQSWPCPWSYLRS